MPDLRLSQRSSDTSGVADQPWPEHYDMSPLRPAPALAYRLFPDPNSGIAISPLPTSASGQRLAMLQLWSPQTNTPSQTLVSEPAPASTSADRGQGLDQPACAAADSARNAHLKVMGELSVSIAHEICQPLLAIASNAAACVRLLQRETPDLDEAICGLKDIRAECQRAADIVAALRALARQSPPKSERLNVDEVIREVLRLSAPALARQNVTLQTQLLADRCVIADPVQIQQLVLNLITNALEAVSGPAASAGIVRVSSCLLDDGVQVSVEDNGPGIPIEEREQIFGAFYTTKLSGLGMGLTICRSVVEAHKGSLCAESSPMGGARIRFQLPAGCTNH